MSFQLQVAHSLVRAGCACGSEGKHRLARLPTADVLLQAGWPLLEQQGFQPLPHRDAFDRLLAAQAELEQLTLLNLDPALDPFPCQTLWRERLFDVAVPG